jgi:hypothetical protein
VLGLADKHGMGRLDAACAKAITVGDPSYRTIRGILAVGAEADPPPPPTGDGGAAAHLHGPLQLFGAVIPTPATPEDAVIPTDATREEAVMGLAATSQALGPDLAGTIDAAAAQPAHTDGEATR